MAGEMNGPSWQGGRPDVGQTFVNGQTAETARALLAAAAGLGLDPSVVAAVRGGFIVPNEVWDAVENQAADGEF